MSVGHPSPIWRGAGGEVIQWKGFTFLKGETFLVTGGFSEGFDENGNQFILAPSPSLPPPAGGGRVPKFRGSWIELRKCFA